MRLHKLKLFFKNAPNEHGFSLIEALVVAGLMGMISYSGLNLLVSMQKSNFVQKYSSQVTKADQDIRTILSDPAACLNTFSGASLVAGASTSITAIKDAANTTRYNTTSTYGDNSVKIYSIVLSNFTQTTGVYGTAKISIAYQPTIQAGQASSLRSFTINTVSGAGNVLSGCTSVSQGLDSLWAKSGVNANDIYYSAGNIAVGTPAPTARLQIKTTINPTVGYQSIGTFHTGTSTNDGAISFGYYQSGLTTTTTNAIESANGLPLSLYAGGVERVQISSIGRWGIGLPNDTISSSPSFSPTANLDLVGPNATWTIRNQTCCSTLTSTLNLRNWVASGSSTYQTSSIATNSGSSAPTGDAYSLMPSSLVIKSPTSGSTIFTTVGDFASSQIIFATGPLTNDEKMRITTNGVGIGTTNPTAMVDVVGAQGTATAMRARGLVGGSAPIDIVFDSLRAGQKFTLSWRFNGTERWQIYKGATNNFVIYDSTGARPAFNFISNGNLQIMPSGGNVAIGYNVSSPAFATTRLTVGRQVGGSGPAVIPFTDNASSLGSLNYRFVNIYATNNVIQTSDRRLKTHITNAQLGLDFIRSLNPVSYVLKNDNDQALHYGFIAQEVAQLLAASNANKTGFVEHDDKSDRFSLSYTEFLAPVVKAAQELYYRFRSLERQLTAARENQARLAIEHEKLKRELCWRYPDEIFCENPKPSAAIHAKASER